MKKIPAIVGKTIKEATWAGAECDGYDSRTLELSFTDGTGFAFIVDAKLSGMTLMFKNDKAKELGKL